MTDMSLIERLTDAELFEGTTRSDVLLLALPVVFALTYALGQLAVGSQPLAVSVASIVCGAIVVDGLFVNPPAGDGVW